MTAIRLFSGIPYLMFLVSYFPSLYHIITCHVMSCLVMSCYMEKINSIFIVYVMFRRQTGKMTHHPCLQRALPLNNYP